MNSLIEGNNQYCGPAVLSILLGKSVDECALLFLKGDKTISVTTGEMIRALEAQRCTVSQVTLASGGSLYSCFHIISRTPGAYIVAVPKHVIAVEVTEDNQVLVCDNHTKFPINGQASARLSQRVNEVLKVELRPKPVFLKLEYQSIKFTERIEIWKHGKYQDKSDDSQQKLRTFYYNTNEELREVIGSLNLMWERNQ